MESGRKLKWFIRCKMIGRPHWKDVPYWVPCPECEYEYKYHIDGHCPFSPTLFTPWATVSRLLTQVIRCCNRTYDICSPVSRLDEDELAEDYLFFYLKELGVNSKDSPEYDPKLGSMRNLQLALRRTRGRQMSFSSIELRPNRSRDRNGIE